MNSGYNRQKILQLSLLIVVLLIVGRLFWLQVIDSDYKDSARNNAMRYMVQYPPRGEVYDRNGEFLVQSTESYDLMVVPRDVEPFDTAFLANTLGVTVEEVRKALDKARSYSRRRPSMIFKQLPKEVKLKLDERHLVGFYTQYRTSRTYPRKIAGNLLGYINEVDEATIKRDPYYRMGDYIGKSGIEKSYEEYLRGTKGVKVELVDVHGMPQGSYADGRYDTLPIPGKAITCTIDARLQEYAEQLMAGKVGSVVAIEPATGEILVMASSPSYDPDKLVGRDLGNNYMELLRNGRHPLFNRAVMSRYPPGSTFKVVNGLIGLQEGVCHAEDLHPCYNGYTIGRGVKCHSHFSPLNLVQATANSCNAYFCYVLRDILDNRKYGGITKGVSNLELTAAYATIANQGIYTKPRFFTQILDHNGKVLLDNTPETKRVLKDSTAFLLTDAMSQSMESSRMYGSGNLYSTSTSANLSNMSNAGKSGTTTSNNDIWFVGYTPYYTAGIWSGCDNNQKISAIGSSTSYHKIIWKNIMTRVHEGLADTGFSIPSSVTTAQVCRVIGGLEFCHHSEWLPEAA